MTLLGVHITLIVLLGINLSVMIYLCYLFRSQLVEPRKQSAFTGPVIGLRATPKGKKLKPISRTEMEEWEMERTNE